MSVERGNLKSIRTSLTAKQPYAGVPSMDYDEAKQEKPWQRAIDVLAKKGTHLYEPVKSVPSPYILLLLGFYLLLGYCAQLAEDAMPAVIRDRDIAANNTNTFSEESARRYLNIILGDQPRVAGTKYHLEKAQDLKKLLDDVASKASLPVRTDWQFVSGDFWIDFKIPHANVYQNLSNIAAVLEGDSGFNPDGSTRESLLVNCHYDSVPYAIGASDNGIFCAAMVEVLVRLSRRKKKFKHNIVFLFNGAEENPLQGSHGFISHPWFKGVTNVINLDSAGMNGKAQVFQATDPRMLSAYGHTNRPTGQSVGQFLFSTGVIPSDTDFRIWRDFGNVQGLDIAFVKWGHVYHTRNDRIEHVKPGVVQCAGDMLLELIIRLCDDDAFKQMKPPSSAVYFDYMNVILVTYSDNAAYVVDTFVCLFAALSILYYIWLVGFRMSTIQELLWALAGRILCTVCGLGVVALCTVLMVATTTQMRYLSQPWIIVAVYWIPYIIAATAAAHLFDSWRTKKTGLNRSIRASQASAATRLLVLGALAVLLVTPDTASVRYLLTVPLLFSTCASIILLTMLRYFRLSGWQHLLIEVSVSTPALLFVLPLAVRLSALLVPIMGRLPNGQPDYVIAAASCLLCVLTAVCVSGIELLFSRKRLWYVAGATSLVCVVIMFVPFSPYQENGVAVQRHTWFHSEIVSYDRNGSVVERTSGILVNKWDVHNVRSAEEALRNSGLNERDLKADCERHPFCNLPLYRPRLGEYLKDSLFLFMEPPNRFDHSLRMTSRTCVGDVCRMQFIMTGPPHNTLTIVPYPNMTLNGWSFSSLLNHSSFHSNQPVYLVTHSTATFSPSFEPLVFSLTFVVPRELQSQPFVRISHDAHRLQDPEGLTPAFKRLTESVPKYFNIAPSVCFKSNYEF
ncbi:unnamed protein product [Pieris macdunnoughi]|uniref:FXNA-like protease n=1 Tax=Pieris macdunnoughi TaxID=345717 RepID=A0A821YMI1_9NEOP|nr:unnamed protein product [Pieris macdunnoughi]